MFSYALDIHFVSTLMVQVFYTKLVLIKSIVYSYLSMIQVDACKIQIGKTVSYTT